jgi:hypothetical protein
MAFAIRSGNMTRQLLLCLVFLAVVTQPTFAKKQKPLQQLPQARGKSYGVKIPPGQMKVHGNNGLGNGVDPQPPGNPPVNDGPGQFPGNPGNKGRGRR